MKLYLYKLEVGWLCRRRGRTTFFKFLKPH